MHLTRRVTDLNASTGRTSWLCADERFYYDRYIPIKIIYLADAQFNIGIHEISIDGSAVKIYDREKTICDMVRYRAKIGIDLMKEGLRNYLQSPSKNITRLVSYADKLRIRTVLQKYLEVLI